MLLHGVDYQERNDKNMKLEGILAIIFLVLNTTLIILLNSLSFSLLIIGYIITVLALSIKTYEREYRSAKEEILIYSKPIVSGKKKNTKIPQGETIQLVNSMKRSIEINLNEPLDVEHNNIFDKRSMYGDNRLKRIRDKIEKEKETS